jgi:hypothetical protein
MTTDDQTEVEFRDLTELGELCGCTEKQRKFSEGLLAGLSQTEAAFRAGYTGARDSVQLRSTASSVAQAKPVQALLALAESRGLGVPNAPGDREELRRILWSHARSKDKQTSIRATVELDRIEREERAGQPARTGTDVLREILGLKHGVGHAALTYLDAVEQYGPRLELTGLPLFRELAPSIAREFPELWQRIRNGLELECRSAADVMAAAAGVPIEELAIKPETPNASINAI